MLKFYTVIFFYIFLNYGSCLIKKKFLEKYNHFKNGKEKGDTIRDQEDGEYAQNRVSRILSSNDDIDGHNDFDHFDISNLKNLLAFQSNLDDQIQKRKREEKKMRKIKEAIERGNIVSGKTTKDSNQQNVHTKEAQNSETQKQTPITEVNIHNPKDMKKRITKNEIHKNHYIKEKVIEPTEKRENVRLDEQIETLQNEKDELFSNGFNETYRKNSIASTLAKNLSTLNDISKNNIYTEESLTPIDKSIKKHSLLENSIENSTEKSKENLLKDNLNKEQKNFEEKFEEKFDKEFAEKKENEKQTQEKEIEYIDEGYRNTVDSTNTKHKKLHEDILNIVEEKAKKKKP